MMGTTSKNLRKYDPKAVKREHIRPITFLYGADKPGIDLRMSRFAELLEESGEEPAILPDASSAVGYIASGTLFSDAFSVVVSDISDALKSSASSEKLRRQLKNAIQSNAQGSTFVMAAILPGRSKPLDDFISFVEQMGGVARPVAAPMAPQALEWTRNYLESLRISLADVTVTALVEAASGKPELIERMVAAIGPELPYLGVSEMREWIDADEEVSTEKIREALAARNMTALVDMRNTYPVGAAGYRSFLLRLRYAAFDLMVASLPGGKDALTTFKSRQYGWDTPVWKTMRLLGDSPSFEKAYAAYAAIESEIEAVSGASRKPASYVGMMAKIAAA